MALLLLIILLSKLIANSCGQGWEDVSVVKYSYIYAFISAVHI